MKKVPKNQVVREAVKEIDQLSLATIVRRGLRELVFDEGLAKFYEILEDERTAVCGPRYAQGPQREARRMGHAPGELVFGGRLVQVRRPRARTLTDEEVTLPSWATFRARDPLNERAVEQMLVGVATRKYARSLEPLPTALPSRGTSKSAVSRRFVAATEKSVASWLRRDLGKLDLLVLMIDGLHVAEHVILVALGIDSDGKKHVLGVREGATENSTSCKALLADLESRGVRTDKPLLAVIDGSKALAKAVRAVFGGCVAIQRCQAHKVRNVEEHLPESMRPSVRHTMRQAYRCGNVTRARKLLANLARRLRDDHPGAASSLEEGLDETLTVMGFGLPAWLERTLATTNAIENLVGSVRQLGGRVKRWRHGRMIVRWTATAVIEAEKRFHRVRDHRGLKILATALAARVQDGSPVVERASA